MWEKSRFKNFIDDQPIGRGPTGPTISNGATPNGASPNGGTTPWYNDTENDIGGLYTYTGFQNENFPTPQYTDGNWTTLGPRGSIANSNCYSEGDIYGALKTTIFNAVSSPPSGAISNQYVAKINQWVELDMTMCFEIDNVNDPTGRPFYTGPKVYSKLIGAWNFYNFKPMFKVGFYYNGELFENLLGVLQSWTNTYGNGSTVIDTNDVWSNVVAFPLIKDDGVPVKTLNELQNFIGDSPSEAEATPQLQVTYLENSIMPDLSQLESALAQELQQKGATVSEANATVTNLLGNYFDAVEFASETLNTKQNELEQAYAICTGGPGQGGICNSIPQLETEVNNLRANISTLQQTETIKNAIDDALQTLADGGEVASNSSSLGVANTSIQAIQSQIGQKDDEIASLTSQVQTKDTAIQELEQAIESTGFNPAQLNNFISGVAQLNTDIENKTNQIANLNTQLTNANNIIASTEAEVVEKAEQIGTLTNQINTANAELTQLTSEKSALESQVSILTSVNEGLNDDIIQNNATITQLEADKVQLNSNIDTLLAQGVLDSTEIDTLNTNLDNVSNQLASALDEKADLQSQLQAEQNLTSTQGAQITNLNNNIGILAQAKLDLEQDIIDLNNDLAEANVLLTNKQQELETAIAQGAANVDAIQDEFDSLNGQYTQLSADKIQVQNQLNDANAEIATLTTSKAEVQAQLAAEQGVSSELTTQLATAVQEKADIQNTLDATIDERDELQTKLTTAENDLATIEAYLDDTSAEQVALVSELQAETTALQESLTRFGYTIPQTTIPDNIVALQTSEFAGGNDTRLFDAVMMAGGARREFLNFKGKVVRNDAIKSQLASPKKNFVHSKRKKVTFRADGGESFEEKYGTLGKIGIIGGLIYLFTRK